MNTQRVIFIAGASHSGSTLVGCVLGSNPKLYQYFHVGEIHSFFRKESPNFGSPNLALKVNGGEIWNTINPRVGYKNAYREIFRKAGSEIIIDSSKVPKYLDTVKEACVTNNYPVHVVITFRPFSKIYASKVSREKGEKVIYGNIRHYIDIYERIVEEFPCTVINIEDLVLSPSMMTKLLCKEVNIPYFSGKENYWNFPSPHLYGSRTQRQHINNPSSASYDRSRVLMRNKKLHTFLDDTYVKSLLGTSIDYIELVENYFISNALKPPSL